MNFRSQLILFAISFPTAALFVLAFGMPWWFLLLPIGFLVFHLVMGAIYIQRNFFIVSQNTLSTSEKKICLTFDDGIHPDITPKVLDILNKFQIPAVFFIIGKNIAGNESILERMVNEGHEVGNHSHDHSFWFDLKSSAAMGEEMRCANQKIEAIIGRPCTIFRPPYGVTNPNLAKAIQQSGMRSIGWSLRSMDTVAKDAGSLLQKLKSETKPGVIVLLHDRCQITTEVLTDYIEHCLSEGYTFVSLTE